MKARVFDLAPVQESFAEALTRGLSQPQKAIPPRFLYDAQGSELFEAITRLPEYYPTRAELEILDRHAGRDGRGDRPGRGAHRVRRGLRAQGAGAAARGWRRRSPTLPSTYR